MYPNSQAKPLDAYNNQVNQRQQPIIQPPSLLPPPPGAPIQWMQRPNQIPNCPIGLEYLTQIDRLIVEQKVDMLEAFTGYEENNKYVVKNTMGQQVFYAFEDTDACMRCCCGSKRRFDINIVDNLNQNVLKMHRDFKCFAGCTWCAGVCACCTQEVRVESSTGECLGYVRQTSSFYKPCFLILDADLNQVLKIQGPCCIIDNCCCCESEFRVLTLDGNNTQCGKVTKKYGGYVQETFTNADTFTIEFPMDLSVKIKACMLAALFLIDFMFFEEKPKQNKRNNHNNNIIMGRRY